MATRVYKEGGFIVIQSEVQNLIDVDNFSFSFNGLNTVLIDQENERTYVDSTANIQDQAGVPIGNEAAVDAYLKTLKPASGGGGGSSDTTAANQVTLIDQTAAKKIGYVLGLSAEAPPPYTDLVEFIQTIEGNATSYTLNNLTVQNTEELAQLFNDLQTDLFYGALSATELYFVPVDVDINDVGAISFEDGNEGVLSFSVPYAETTDLPTGAMHQLVTLEQKQNQLVKNLINLSESSFAIASTLNSSTTPLGIGATFTGTGELNTYPSVKVIPYADQNGILYVEFSNDGITWTTSLQYVYDTTKINPPHTFTKGVRFYRTRFENTSGIAQTVFNIITCYGDFNSLTSSINSTLAQNFDATSTRPTHYFSEVARGKRQGEVAFNKFGENLDFNSGDGRVIVSSFGGSFTPLSTGALLEIVSTSANDIVGGTGCETIRIAAVDDNGLPISVDVNLNGTTVVPIVAQLFLGINRAAPLVVGSTGKNQGDITIRVAGGGAIQAFIPAFKSSTQQLLFYVPSNARANKYALRFDAIKTTNGNSELTIFRMRRSPDGVISEKIIAQLEVTTNSGASKVITNTIPEVTDSGYAEWYEAETTGTGASLSGEYEQIIVDN